MDNLQGMTRAIEKLREDNIFRRELGDASDPKEIASRLESMFLELKAQNEKGTGTLEERTTRALDLFFIIIKFWEAFPKQSFTEELMKRTIDSIITNREEGQNREQAHHASYELALILKAAKIRPFASGLLSEAERTDIEARYGGGESADCSPKELTNEMMEKKLGVSGIDELLMESGEGPDVPTENADLVRAYVQRMILIGYYPATDTGDVHIPEYLLLLVSHDWKESAKKLINDSIQKYHLEPHKIDWE